MENTCMKCKFRDEYQFCNKLVVDTRWTIIENDKRVRSYYVSVREEEDSRPAFMISSNFGCNEFQRKV